jgi:hypothetical protein
MLHITQSGSFKMDRKMKDGSIQPNSRRYAYTVSGNAAEIAQFKRDIAEGTNKGAQLLENGELRYYSWRKCIGNTGVLMRSKLGNWFIDTEALDDLESLSEQSPALMKALGSELINRLIPQKPIEKAKPEANQEPEDDGTEPF